MEDTAGKAGGSRRERPATPARHPAEAGRRGSGGRAISGTAGGTSVAGGAGSAHPAAGASKAPRTERGRRTLRKVLDAAAIEFGELGFHQAAISGITQRAGVALGTFYTYFDSKEAVFRALVADMGRMTRHFLAEQLRSAPDRLTMEREGVAAFVQFARAHKNLYRIVMESQFVAEDAYRAYYATFAEAYATNLAAAAARGEIRPGVEAYRAWALIGVNVFLGMRFAVWDDSAPIEDITRAVGDFLAHGLSPEGAR